MFDSLFPEWSGGVGAGPGFKNAFCEKMPAEVEKDIVEIQCPVEKW